MTNSPVDRQKHLIEANIRGLRQIADNLGSITDAHYAATSPEFAPQRIGGQVRHIVEFYECFLDGLPSAHIDYNERKRDMSLETHRSLALERIQSLVLRLAGEPSLQGDSVVWVRMEDARAAGALSDTFLLSSVGRELQALSTHTIHHSALIAFLLRELGVPVNPAFGVAPSTLRYRTAQANEDAVGCAL